MARLDQWVRNILINEELRSAYGRCTRLTLVPAGRDNEVYSLGLAGRQWDPKEIADLFREKAEHHAETLPETRTFYLRAFFGDRRIPQESRRLSVNTRV